MTWIVLKSLRSGNRQIGSDGLCGPFRGVEFDDLPRMTGPNGVAAMHVPLGVVRSDDPEGVAVPCVKF